jgi:hypothetical protein
MIRPAGAINLIWQAAVQPPTPEPFHAERREPRSQTEMTFAICGLASTGRFFVEHSSTVNVSRSGCCLRLHTRPLAGSALALRVVPGGPPLPDGASQLLFQLAWLRPEGDSWLIGAFVLGKVGLSCLAFPPNTL